MHTAIHRRPAHASNGSGIAAERQHEVISIASEELAGIVSQYASSNDWMDRVRLRSGRRWYERVYAGPNYDIWLISWLSGQSTGFHDHGDSSGAFVVATGILEEHRSSEQTLVMHPGVLRSFGPGYAHDVRNVSQGPAISIHAYSPPFEEMNEYVLEGSRLVPREPGSEWAEPLDQKWRVPWRSAILVSSIEQILLAARARLRRLTPDEAYGAVEKTEAILVDIRPEGQRANEGSIPGALIVDRNVLEWRFDPESKSRLRVATDHDLHVIVFCSEGYTSSLAASSLQNLGLWRATDMIGGFHAWRGADLPIVPPSGAL
jgi:rhodanese-related sulfurtransferase/quercetin dioxygenase-like cupin family protein